MTTTERRGAEGPLLVRPVLSSSRNEKTSPPRAARCKQDISRQGFEQLAEDFEKTRELAKKRRGSSADSAGLSDASTPKSPQSNSKRLILTREASAEFERRVSPPRLQTISRTTQQTSLSPTRCRRPSITTDVSNLPPRIFRNASIEMLDKFKALEVQESQTCGLQPASDGLERLGHSNALEVQGPRTRSRSLHPEVEGPLTSILEDHGPRTRSRSTIAEATMTGDTIQPTQQH